LPVVRCRVTQRRLGRLHHRRFERSGAAAAVARLLKRAFSAALAWAFARSTNRSPNQLSRRLEPLFPSTRPQPQPASAAPLCEVVHTPELLRRLSTEKQGSPRFSVPSTRSKLSPETGQSLRAVSGPRDGLRTPGLSRVPPKASADGAVTRGGLLAREARPSLDTRSLNLTGRVGEKA
jgi:hypothetical protein